VTTQASGARGAIGGAAGRDLLRRVGQVASGPFEWVIPLGGMLLIQQLFLPATWGVVLDGALYGGRIALIALGITLVYRANRIVNFAQGDVGGLPAVLGVMLVIAWQWSYWLGLAVGLAAALLLGALVETLIIRRFSEAPRLVLTVATIGLAQALTAGAFLLPRAFGQDFGESLPQPFGAHFTFGGTTFYGHDILTIIVVPIALLLLAIFLQRSTIGVAIIGAAERPDRAAGLGIPVKRLHTVVWAVAAVLSFLAMYLRAGVVGLQIGTALPVFFLVQALAAAVFGRFSKFTTVGASAIGIGILDRAIVFQDWRLPAHDNLLVFGVVLVGLILVPRRGSGRVDADASTWQATCEVRPVPRELKGIAEVRAASIIGWAVAGVFVFTLPLWLSSSQMSLATVIVIFGIVAASLVVLTGWGGQVSLGHMAFVGVGAAVGGKLTDQGWDLGLSMLAAGLVGGLAAVVVGYPALRRRGLTLAVSTLAFALLVHEYVLSPTVSDWLPDDRIENPTLLGAIPIRSEHAVFNVSVVTLLLALAMVTGLRRSRTGRVLIAIRENERAAQSYGVNVIRTQLAAFALSGFLAALAGALYVQQAHDLDPGPYAPERSLQLFCMVVIGGLGSVSGALLGTIYVQGADFFLPAEWKFLASGVGLLAMLMIFPSGLGGLVAMGRDSWLRWVAKRRGIVVPSLMGERLADEAEGPPERDETGEPIAPGAEDTDQEAAIA